MYHDEGRSAIPPIPSSSVLAVTLSPMALFIFISSGHGLILSLPSLGGRINHHAAAFVENVTSGVHVGGCAPKGLLVLDGRNGAVEKHAENSLGHEGRREKKVYQAVPLRRALHPHQNQRMGRLPEEEAAVNDAGVAAAKKVGHLRIGRRRRTGGRHP